MVAFSIATPHDPKSTQASPPVLFEGAGDALAPRVPGAGSLRPLPKQGDGAPSGATSWFTPCGVSARISSGARLPALHCGLSPRLPPWFSSGPRFAGHWRLRQRAPRGRLVVAWRAGFPGPPGCRFCETCPRGPHPAPPARRLMKAPLGERGMWNIVL